MTAQGRRSRWAAAETISWHGGSSKTGTTSLTSYAVETSASGLAAVWATDNTRAAIFEAIERRETYATTGPRILVGVFGGWDFEPEDTRLPNFAGHGYANGVPMGGDLASASDGKAPTFVVRAVRDPDGANLDRVQIVKGWMDGSGRTNEKVYDVALSDGREVGPDGMAPPVGDTVDVANASYKNTIGDALLFAHWSDPDFDSSQHAFYYARVIEIPTPRISTWYKTTVPLGDTIWGSMPVSAPKLLRI